MLKLVGRLVISSPQLETKGEINKVSWMVGTDFGSEITDYPDKIEGGQYARDWLTNSGYFGKVISLGSEKLSPLKLTFNALTAEDVEKLRFYYTRRKYVIAEYREFKGKLARIANMRANPIRGTKYIQVTLTITEVPAFRVYRSVDYGETYQQASDRVNTEFYDYGFVYAGQVRYRIQYDPPDGSSQYDGIELFGETETLRISRVDIPPSEPYDLPVANVSGSMKIADTFITGSITEPTAPITGNVYYDYLPPMPEIDRIESHRLYTNEGMKPAIKVFLKYPSNVFDVYPDTIIIKEKVYGSLVNASGMEHEIEIEEGLNPFTLLTPGVGEMNCAFVFVSENLYGTQSARINVTFNVDNLPYNDLVKAIEPYPCKGTENKRYTYINQNNFVSDTHIAKNPVIPDAFEQHSEYFVPPEMNKLDGGTHSDTWVIPFKDVIVTDFTENSDYDEIHYT